MKRILALLALAVLLAACSGHTTDATKITSTSATLNATVACGDNGDRSTNCWYYFRWGVEDGSESYPFTSHYFGPYGSTCGNGCSVPVSWNAVKLTPNTTYAYKLCGWGDGIGTQNHPVCVGPDGSTSSDSTFTTSP